jgi:hypothetical protein
VPRRTPDPALEQLWRHRLDRFSRSGLSVRAFRSRERLPATSFYFWRRQLAHRELAGWGLSARSLSRVLRLCLRYGVSPVFIPAGEPQLGGSVENFNGWFQEPLFDRRFRRPGDLRRELARLQGAVNTGRGTLTAYLNGRVVKRWPDKLLND